jgi:putative methionine-R-sulfoxide reductase with GAF domain
MKMVTRDLNAFREAAWQALIDATAAVTNAADVEQAFATITKTTRSLLGDKEAHLRPNALKPGERHFSVAGIFLVSEAKRENILVAEDNFPPEQHRLRIPIEHGHPGWVVQHKKPLLLTNTDEHSDFKQILKTSRMGSAVFGPLIWKGRMLGQIVTASQARNTYSDVDRDVTIAFANLAATAFIAHGGDDLVKQIG